LFQIFFRFLFTLPAAQQYAYNIKCLEVKKDASGTITELVCEVDTENKSKPKGKIQWVAEPQPGQVRLERINSLASMRVCSIVLTIPGFLDFERCAASTLAV